MTCSRHGPNIRITYCVSNIDPFYHFPCPFLRLPMGGSKCQGEGGFKIEEVQRGEGVKGGGFCREEGVKGRRGQRGQREGSKGGSKGPRGEGVKN